MVARKVHPVDDIITFHHPAKVRTPVAVINATITLILAPFLFYINALEVNMKIKIKFFADDTELNHDLQLINNWAYQWEMPF